MTSGGLASASSSCTGISSVLRTCIMLVMKLGGLDIRPCVFVCVFVGLFVCVSVRVWRLLLRHLLNRRGMRMNHNYFYTHTHTHTHTTNTLHTLSRARAIPLSLYHPLQSLSLTASLPLSLTHSRNLPTDLHNP